MWTMFADAPATAVITAPSVPVATDPVIVRSAPSVENTATVNSPTYGI